MEGMGQFGPSVEARTLRTHGPEGLTPRRERGISRSGEMTGR